MPSQPAPALPNLGSNNQETTHANAGGGRLLHLHPPPRRSRQRDGETQDGCLSEALRTTGGENQLFGAANAFKEAEAGAEAEGTAGLKQTPPCPACLSAAASAVVSCAWSGPGGRRRGEEALWLPSHTPPACQSPAMLPHGYFWASLLPSRSQSFIGSLPAPGQFPGEAAPPT